MTCELILNPEGHLLLRSSGGQDAAGAKPLPAALQRAFAQGSGHGLIELARQRDALPADPAAFHFWRAFADLLLEKLAHFPGSDEGAMPDTLPLDPELAFDWSLRVPAMPGAEYASPAVISSLWAAAFNAAREAASKTGLRRWLAGINPALHLVGRVTFHLAENKRSASHPFAFMATYTHRLSAGDKPAHLPLGRALEQYVGQKNQAALASLLEPVRKASETSLVVRGLLETRKLFQPQAWTPGEAYAFLKELPAIEAAGVITRIPDWWRNGKGARPKVSVRIGDAAKGGLNSSALLDFSIGVALGGEQLSSAEIKTLLAAGSGLVSLRGQWVEADAARLKEALDHWKNADVLAKEGIPFHEAMRLLAGFKAAPSGGDEQESAAQEWSEVVAGTRLAEALRNLADPAARAAFDPNEGLSVRLRPYQEKGVRWLWLLARMGLGACLADDMGLGKTLQVIALLNRLKAADQPAPGKEPPPPSLLIAPASLLANWTSEIARFAPQLRAVVLHASAHPPAKWSTARAAAPLLKSADLAITTYGQAVRLAWLASCRWRLVILDEAQAVKNPGSRQAQAVKRLPAEARVALTGTPVENRLGDLWSLFDFLNPGLLGGAKEFSSAVRQMQRSEPPDYAPLRRLIRPFLLRRLKTDKSVIADLPDKTEMPAWCALTKKQAALYAAAVSELGEKLKSAGGIQRRGVVLAFLTRFKQICNHPSHWLNDGSFDPGDSGKFERLAALAGEIASRQEKALVFTQFREMTGPLADFLARLFGSPGLVLHGGTPVARRQALVRDFAREEGPPFFVLSLKAGGAGLNLTAASHVIHFDRWWNPAVEDQATDRAFRIGQSRNVLVHKFICRGTLEERIDALITSKKDLALSAIGPDDGAAAALTEMSDKELLEFVSLDLAAAMAE